MEHGVRDRDLLLLNVNDSEFSSVIVGDCWTSEACELPPWTPDDTPGVLVPPWRHSASLAVNLGIMRGDLQSAEKRWLLPSNCDPRAIRTEDVDGCPRHIYRGSDDLAESAFSAAKLPGPLL
jgi:hypothetical protein